MKKLTNKDIRSLKKDDQNLVIIYEKILDKEKVLKKSLSKLNKQKVKLRADGLIISSSLGSTAYNYSAGGPIVQTSINSLIITPISPFTKFPRSIVLDNKSEIKITILKKQDYSIQFDGAEVIEGNEEKDIVFDYKLSKNELMVMEESDDPKLDHFLNQILR